jgi:hypothetical protein
MYIKITYNHIIIIGFKVIILNKEKNLKLEDILNFIKNRQIKKLIIKKFINNSPKISKKYKLND